jgi:hypothetical protein
MLTPSLKVKRRKVVEVYQPLLDALYAKKKEKGDGADKGAGGAKKKAEASVE